MKIKWNLICCSLCLFVVFNSLQLNAQTMEQAWNECGNIEKQIKKTSFPQRTFNIRDFGAKEGKKTCAMRRLIRLFWLVTRPAEDAF